jgi:hypothetical protein
MAVSDHHLHPGAPDRFVHCSALVERDSHWLFDQHMLSLRRRLSHVFRVQLVRCRDIDDFDLGIRAHRFDARVGLRAELGRETRGRRRPWISARHESHTPVCGESRQHQRKSSTQARHTDLEAALRHRALFLSTFAMELSIVP